GEGRQLAPEVDQVLVALGPVAEEAEFFLDGLLGGGGGGFEGEGGVGQRFHAREGGMEQGRVLSQKDLVGAASAAPTRALVHIDGYVLPRFQRTPCGVSSSTMPSAASWSRMASARAKSRAFLAAARSSISAWMRASSSPDAPRPNQSAGACCSRPSAEPAARRLAIRRPSFWISAGSRLSA